MKLFSNGSLKTVTLAAAFLAQTSAANAYSYAYSASESLRIFSFPSLEYAQAQVNSLNESDLRRLNFYTGRAIEALAALAEEDRLAGQNGGALSGNTVAALRDAVSRLIDAGRRSGLTQNDIADYFQLASEQSLASEIPLALQNSVGKIDARTLFLGIANGVTAQPEPQAAADYLALLNAESVDLDLGLNGESDQQTTETVEIVANGPQPLGGATAAAREIISRVVVDGDNWRIIVIRGDNLAAYASAIYGDSLSYRIIYNANTRILVNANTLEVGQVLSLPKP